MNSADEIKRELKLMVEQHKISEDSDEIRKVIIALLRIEKDAIYGSVRGKSEKIDKIINLALSKRKDSDAT